MKKNDLRELIKEELNNNLKRRYIELGFSDKDIEKDINEEMSDENIHTDEIDIENSNNQKSIDIELLSKFLDFLNNSNYLNSKIYQNDKIINDFIDVNQITEEFIVDQGFNIGDTVKYHRDITAGDSIAIGKIKEIKGNSALVIKEQGLNIRKDWVKLKNLIRL